MRVCEAINLQISFKGAIPHFCLGRLLFKISKAVDAEYSIRCSFYEEQASYSD